jgi:hypothetical protein
MNLNLQRALTQNVPIRRPFTSCAGTRSSNDTSQSSQNI